MKVTIELCDDADPETIKKETTRLRKEIGTRKREIEIMSTAIKQYQKMCSHPGQQTGHNERDGSWANPCDICGECH